jgi:hypothetical protein
MKTFKYIVFIPVLLITIPVSNFVLKLIEGIIPLLNDLRMDVEGDGLFKIPFLNYVAVFGYAMFTFIATTLTSLFLSSLVYPIKPSKKIKLLMISVHLFAVLIMFYFAHTFLFNIIDAFPKIGTEHDVTKLWIHFGGAIVGSAIVYIGFYSKN